MISVIPILGTFAAFVALVLPAVARATWNKGWHTQLYSHAFDRICHCRISESAQWLAASHQTDSSRRRHLRRVINTIGLDVGFYRMEARAAWAVFALTFEVRCRVRLRGVYLGASGNVVI